jgi:protein TonB
MAMAGFAKAETAPPELPSYRLAGWGISVAGHALVLAVLVALAWHAVAPPEPPADPVRLVFLESAPPPRLGVPNASGSDPSSALAQQVAPAPEPAPVPAVERPVAKPQARAPERRRVASVARKVEKSPPAAPPEPVIGTAPAEAAPGAVAQQAAAPGVADGSQAGVTGGLPGGKVGGLGSEVTPLSKAAVPPRIVHSVLPVYPERARLRGIEGEVMIEAVIAPDGGVEPDIHIVRSIPELDQAAIDAFRRWRFSPARDSDGRALRVLLQAPVRFVLR